MDALAVAVAPEELAVLEGLRIAGSFPVSAPVLAARPSGPRPTHAARIAVATAAGAAAVVTVSGATPFPIFVAGIVAPACMAVVWLVVYRGRAFGYGAEAVVLAALCVFAMAVDARWKRCRGGFAGSRGLLRRGLRLDAPSPGQDRRDGRRRSGAGTERFQFLHGLRHLGPCVPDPGEPHARHDDIARALRTHRPAREQILAAAGLDLVAAAI